MTRVGADKREESQMYSANQSVESLVISIDGLKKSESIPRNMPIELNPREIDNLDEPNRTERTGSGEESSPSIKAVRKSETAQYSEVATDFIDASEMNVDRESSSDMEQMRDHSHVERVDNEKKTSKSSHSFGSSTRENKAQTRSNASIRDNIKDETSRFYSSESIEESVNKPRSQSYANTSNTKTDTVRFSKSANSVIPSTETNADEKSVDISYNSIIRDNSAKAQKAQIDDWPAQERRQNVRLPGSDEEDRPKKARSRGKSDIGSIKHRRPTGKASGVIEALDLEEMGMEKRAKIREESKDDSEFGDSKRSLPQQKAKKSKHKGRVEPDSEDESGYNSDGSKQGSKHQKTRPSPIIHNGAQIYQQSNSSSPMIQNTMQPNYQQMVMYGYRPQDQFQFQPQPFGNYIQPDFMMQQPVWNSQPNPGQWMHPSMAPQNFNPYQFFPNSPAPAVLPIANIPTQVPIPEKENVAKISPVVSAAAIQQEDGLQQVVLIPKPPISSPPPRVKSPRKVDAVQINTEVDELSNPITSILAELPDPSKRIPVNDTVEGNNENQAKNSSPDLIDENLVSTPAILPVTAAAPLQTASEEPITAPIVLIAAQPDLTSAIRQNIIAPPIPYIVSQEVEQQRLAAMHALGILNTDEHPRLTKITQMTARLLGRSCCVLSLVDSDKVIWKSVSPPVTSVTEEPRYESFCSWVVQDESGRGVTVLDSKTDPRCTHIRVKPGLEFYAGVPVTLGGKHKIGALSIQGPPSAQISVIDMNILHEMAVWASGELDTILIQKTLQDREMYIQARDRLGDLATKAKTSDKPADTRSMEKSLGLIRTALRANCVLLLKLAPDAKGFQSTLQAYSFDPTEQKTGNLLVGEEIFHELCSLTLKKESGGESALLLENLKTGSVTKDVDHYLSKKINKCMSELLWSASGPTAVLAAFFDDTYRTISKEEFSFIKSIVPTISSIYDSMELKDSFHQAINFSKNMGASLKKFSVTFGKQQGLAPCLVMIEPRLQSFKGYEKVGSMNELELSPEPAHEATMSDISQSGPKGQAFGQVLAQKQDSFPGAAVNSESSESKAILELNPSDSFDILNDFTQMMELLADKFSLKRPKRLGLQYYLFANYGQDTGTLASAASFAHEVFFAIDTYNIKKRKNLKTRIGIHLDFVSADVAQDSSALKDQLLGLVNGAYQLESRADSILTSELFYHQTKQYCSYENSPYPIVVRGQGAFSTYRLIGITQEVLPQTEPVPAKENGVNDGASLITSIVPSPLNIRTSTTSGEAKLPTDQMNGVSVTSTSKPPLSSPNTNSKKFRCSIM